MNTRTITVPRNTDDRVRDFDHYSRWAGLRVVHTSWDGTQRTGTVAVNVKRCANNPNCACNRSDHPGHVQTSVSKPFVIRLDDGGHAFACSELAVVDA